jgi:uncharacterized membrane protein YheB (UPF0754 family)
MLIELKYLLLPIIGAAIGWLTNYVAIKLLFRPHVPLNIMGFKLQGLIPKRRKEIARSMASAIEKELLSSKDLAGTLDSIDWKDEIEKTVEDVVEHRLKRSKMKSIPLIGLLSENLTYHIKSLLSKEIHKQFEKKKDEIATRLGEQLDVESMLTARIDELDLTRFENLLTSFITKELKHIEWLGGLMGFFIGLAQAILFYALS